MCSSHFLVEVDVKIEVLLAVLRNKTRKSLRNPSSCTVLTSASDAKKSIKKEHGGFNCLRSYVPYYTLPLYDWIYI